MSIFKAIDAHDGAGRHGDMSANMEYAAVPLAVHVPGNTPAQDQIRPPANVPGLLQVPL